MPARSCSHNVDTVYTRVAARRENRNCSEHEGNDVQNKKGNHTVAMLFVGRPLKLRLTFRGIPQ